MRELRDRGAERLIKQNLFVSVREVVLTANHVRDAHLNVVENNRQVIKRMAIGSQQPIFDLGVRAFLLPYLSVSARAFRERSINRKCSHRSRSGVRFFQRQIAILLLADRCLRGLRTGAVGMPA